MIVREKDRFYRKVSFPAAERERDRLAQEAEGLKSMLASVKDEKRKAQEENSELQQILLHVQGRCREKIRVRITTVANMDTNAENLLVRCPHFRG